MRRTCTSGGEDKRVLHRRHVLLPLAVQTANNDDDKLMWTTKD